MEKAVCLLGVSSEFARSASAAREATVSMSGSAELRSVAAASSTAAGSQRRDSGDAERDQTRASGVDLSATDALNVVESDVLSCAMQASVVDLLNFEPEGLTGFGDDFHTIVRVKRLRQLRAPGCHRLRRHTAQHRKARVHDDYHLAISLHVQLLLHSAKDFVSVSRRTRGEIGSDAAFMPETEPENCQTVDTLAIT